MKKLLVLLFIISITSCNQEAKKQEIIISAEKIEAKRIGDSIIKADQDLIDIEEAKRQAYLSRPWKQDSFVDDFGDATNKKYIQTHTEGLFSNSATSNEDLFVSVIITKTSMGLFLKEYNETRPAEKFIGTGTLRLKNEAGKTITAYSYSEWNSSGGISINGKYRSLIVSFLKSSVGKVRFAVRDKYSSSYSFSIDVTGFSKEFSLL